jgi:hypothetical protein
MSKLLLGVFAIAILFVMIGMSVTSIDAAGKPTKTVKLFSITTVENGCGVISADLIANFKIETMTSGDGTETKRSVLVEGELTDNGKKIGYFYNKLVDHNPENPDVSISTFKSKITCLNGEKSEITHNGFTFHQDGTVTFHGRSD